MNPDAGDTLYEDVVNITHEYLGPAADRFVTRQIRNHLHKNPEELKKQDLKGLIDWIGLAMSLLSEDEALVHKYVTNLNNLTDKNGRRHK
jgi:hypothetical protein